MARRRAGKANREGAPLPDGRRAKAAAPETPASGLDAPLIERVAALECERDALRAALELERARRRALEEVHAATRDRIAWALDSLQGILNAKTCAPVIAEAAPEECRGRLSATSRSKSPPASRVAGSERYARERSHRSVRDDG
jgi:hypothetical protein